MLLNKRRGVMAKSKRKKRPSIWKNKRYVRTKRYAMKRKDYDKLDAGGKASVELQMLFCELADDNY